MTAGSARAPVASSLARTLEQSSILERLLHALNQPLTGLQCAMEVALAAPRSVGQYAQTLRDALELAGRMRVLVGAVREVLDSDKTAAGEGGNQAIEIRLLLEELLHELAPVAEQKSIRIILNCRTTPKVKARPAQLRTALFRLFESGMNLARPGSAFAIEASIENGALRLDVHWDVVPAAGPMSSAEIGLLLAQAGCEHSGGRWESLRTETAQSVILRLASA